MEEPSERLRLLLDRLFDYLHKPPVLRRKGSDETNDLFNLLCEEGMVITGALRDVTSISERENVCQALVDFYESRGQVSKLLRNAIDREVRKTESKHQLFVTNSFDCKIISYYIHTVGRDYLTSTLKPFSQRICADPPSVEIDPMKLEPGESLDNNLFTLMDTSQKLLDSIFASAGPDEILEVCEAIYYSVHRRFPDRRRAAVGNFIFLRFFIPALTNPMMYGLVEAPPSPKATRVFTLVAKCIQSLVNRVHSSGFKGMFNELSGVERHGEFIIRNLNSLINFFDDMSVIPPPAPTQPELIPTTTTSTSASSTGGEMSPRPSPLQIHPTEEEDICSLRNLTISNITAVGQFLANDPYATACEDDLVDYSRLRTPRKLKSAGFLQLYARRRLVESVETPPPPHDHYAYYEGIRNPTDDSASDGGSSSVAVSSHEKPQTQSLMHRRLDKLTDCVANPGYGSQRLHDLLLEPDLGVALAIGDTCPESERGQIATSLVTIFEANGQAMLYIPAVVDRELQLQSTPNVFLHGNTMTSKVLSAYSKLIGLEYIRATLRQPIMDIVASTEPTEIDPSKLPGCTEEQLDINNRRLSRVAQDLFDAVRNSVKIMPTSLRRLCGHIQQVTKNHFSDSRINPVGIFLFMRFICPAIVTPEVYGAVESAPDPTDRRTLVLAAKLLQHLTTTSKSSRMEREGYMQKQEQFINVNRDAADLLFTDVMDMRLVPRTVGVSPPPKRVLDVVGSLSIIHRHLIFDIDRVGDALPSRRPGEHTGEERALRFGKLLLAPGLGLCSAICSITKKEDRELLTSALVRVFANHGQATRLIKGAIRRELLYTADVRSVFLENSVCNILITKFFHHIGSGYLKDILGDIVKRFIDDPSGYEIEPGRLDAGENVNDNMDRLMDAAQEVVESIFSSVDSAPPGLREICHFLQTHVAERDPQHRYSFIGAFLFLRFFGPALISPEVYGVSTRLPSPKSRRVLILMAKTLQHLANRAQIGTKEEYMKEMNRFIISNLMPTMQFFAKLVESGTVSRVARGSGRVVHRVVEESRARSGTGGSSSSDTMRRERSMSDKRSPESILRSHLVTHYNRIAEIILSVDGQALEWNDEMVVTPSNPRHTVGATSGVAVGVSIDI